MSRTVVDPINRAPASNLPKEEPPVPGVTQSSTYQSSSTQSTLARLGSTFVLIGFAGIFLYGHLTDWEVPKFRAFLGGATQEPDDWCEEHSVPESICVECDPSLIPKDRDFGWCEEHGVQNCVLHHPEIAQLKSTASVESADLQRAHRALTALPRAVNNSQCKEYKKRIQFASVESVRQAGVDVELVDRKRIVESVHGNGSIVYDPTRVSALASRASGNVWKVSKNVGDDVLKGEVLGYVEAAEVGNLKTSLLKALVEAQLQERNVQRFSQAQAAVSESLLINARAALSKARADVLSVEQSLRNLGLKAQLDNLVNLPESEVMRRLKFLGIPESEIGALSREADTSNLIPILSPLDGVVIDRTVALGEVVDTTKQLFRVADVSQMWLVLNIPQEQVSNLKVGQSVIFRSDANRDAVSGKLEWISTTVDRNTRSVQVRAVLSNQTGNLKNETFGAGEIILREELEAIVIPTDASHWEGCCQIVFVRDKSFFDSPDSYKVFHVRTVRLGATNGKLTEVIAGVLPGEVIAVAGSDVLRAQLLKNNLGAGCDCVAK